MKYIIFEMKNTQEGEKYVKHHYNKRLVELTTLITKSIWNEELGDKSKVIFKREQWHVVPSSISLIHTSVESQKEESRQKNTSKNFTNGTTIIKSQTWEIQQVVK